MKCPWCGEADTQVVDSRVNEDGDTVRRRRRCAQCGKRFTTYERIERQWPQVVKKNGCRVDFERAKLKSSLLLALRKRPVSGESVDAAIERIEERLVALGVREVSTQQIGELVMRELRTLDKVAYVRFASVYRSFEDVNDFSQAVREVKRPSSEGGGPP